MADYTMSEDMDACIREVANTSQQTAGRAAFDAASNTELTAVDGKADANAANIATNTADIATNTAGVATNAADITTIEGEITRWKGVWPSGGTTAQPFDQYRDDEWLAIANTATTDRPAPQPSGDASTELPDVPAWTTASHVGQIKSDTLYSFTEGGWIQSIQVWVPSIDPAITYALEAADITDPANPITQVFTLPTLVASEWNTVKTGSTVVTTGTQLLVRLTSLNSSSTTQNSAPWVYEGTSNAGTPANTLWNNRSQQDELRINYTDNNYINQASVLNSVIPGSTIKCTESAEPNNYYIYSVTGSSDLGTAREYNVTLIETGLGGGPTVGELCDILFDVPVAASTDAVRVVDQWVSGDPTWADIDSQLYFSDVQQDLDDAFGHRISFQPAYVSPDWDLQASLSAAGGGAGAFSAWSASGAGVAQVKDSGWGNYVDSTYTTGSRLTVNNAKVQLTNDALGAATNTDYLPTPDGSPHQLWASDIITPYKLGDTMMLRITFMAEGAPAGGDYGDLVLDIGTVGTPVEITRRRINLGTDEASVSVAFPVFCLATFLANGCKLYFDTSGSGDSVEVWDFSIFLKLAI